MSAERGSDSSYSHMRQVATDLTARMPEDHPCREGNGACCYIRNLKVTIGDILVIQEGIEKGEISENILAQARKHKKDTVEVEGEEHPDSRCVFLDRRTNRCLIYKRRPLQCMIYASGGIPESDQEMEKREEEAKAKGEEGQLHMKECKKYPLCSLCTLMKALVNPMIPIKDIKDYRKVRTYIENEDTFSLEAVISSQE